jgi:hypothetical protein
MKKCCPTNYPKHTELDHLNIIDIPVGLYLSILNISKKNSATQAAAGDMETTYLIVTAYEFGKDDPK